MIAIYIDSIYIVLGVMRNLELIYSLQEDVCSFSANTMPFYIKNLSIWGFEKRSVLELILHG